MSSAYNARTLVSCSGVSSGLPVDLFSLRVKLVSVEVQGINLRGGTARKIAIYAVCVQ